MTVGSGGGSNLPDERVIEGGDVHPTWVVLFKSLGQLDGLIQHLQGWGWEETEMMSDSIQLSVPHPSALAAHDGVCTHLSHHLNGGAFVLEPLNGEGRCGAGHNDSGWDAQPPGGVGSRHARVARCQWRGRVRKEGAGIPGGAVHLQSDFCLILEPQIWMAMKGYIAAETRAQREEMPGAGPQDTQTRVETERKLPGHLPEEQTKCLQPCFAFCGDKRKDQAGTSVLPRSHPLSI